LVAFGGAETSTVNAVLLYRLISFWFILVVGWLFIGQMALQVRRGRWSRSAMAAAVEAGPVAYLHPSQAGTLERGEAPELAGAALAGAGGSAGEAAESAVAAQSDERDETGRWSTAVPESEGVPE
jgi:hypothetical protein